MLIHCNQSFFQFLFPRLRRQNKGGSGVREATKGRKVQIEKNFNYNLLIKVWLKNISLLTILLLFSCKEKTTFPIPPDKMVIVLADVHLAEAAAGHLSAKMKDSVLQVYYEQIYEMHEIEKADFDSTMTLLRSNPKWLGDLYGKVMEEIDTHKANSTKK